MQASFCAPRAWRCCFRPGNTPIHGKRARRLAKAAQRLQQILGDHQDSVLARGLLTRATASDQPPETARTYTLLLEIEERIARHTQTAYRKAATKSSLNIRLRH